MRVNKANMSFDAICHDRGVLNQFSPESTEREIGRHTDGADFIPSTADACRREKYTTDIANSIIYSDYQLGHRTTKLHLVTR